MGLPLARLVALCLALTLARGEELRRGEGQRADIRGNPEQTVLPGRRRRSSSAKGRTRNHGHNICSTWGDFHYKTFDGDVFRFPGLCDYNFASDCRDTYKEFAVHLKRGPGHKGGHPQVEYILLTVKDDTVYLTPELAVLNGAMVSTPHYSPGLLIERNDAYTKVYSRAGLTLLWDREDSLMLELDSKFQNHTCGLCGDYNGLQSYSEFLSDGMLFSAVQFGNMQKINKPEVVCDDPEEGQTPESCSEHRAECEKLLTAAAFKDCLGLVPLEPYVRACVQDRCQCPSGVSCVCSTLAEFSRQCSHAGGRPGNWRTGTLCPKSCPGNMVYLESGSPCMDTCSHLEVSNLCEEHRMDGCFCPEGTVYDDIAGGGCIPVSQCHCKLQGQKYAPGQKITKDCEQCVCNAGRWVCKDRPCPGSCALEGGSHITTFDGKRYTFHGDCYYVLTKSDHNDSYALLGELAVCGSTDKQTCLKTVVLLADKKQNVVVFKSDGTVLLNELQVKLPHVTASFSIFQPSSHHLIVNTAFGLRMQVQLVPVMQLFLTLDQAAQGRVQGLCGNFNGLEGDDFKTAGGLVEAMGASFANTWKVQSSCPDKLDWLDDPCSLNIESANYAEHWCSLLRKTESPFGRCHSVVDPAQYYKRCKYDTCNCQNNEECLCAALSSYARACAAKGVMLWGWRENVCNRDVGSCPNSQIFLYNLTTCQQTCRSLSEADAHCLQGFAPVDGCGCPDRTFLDEKGRCVPLAKCSCYHRAGVAPLSAACKAPKIHIDCNNQTALTIRNPRPLSCQTLAAGHVRAGTGLIDDGRGGCVVEEDCPCVHNKGFFSAGDTRSSTCQRGRWACTQSVCHGTCVIHGSSHYITFDGKYYNFDGQCSYVAVQDYCGQNSSLGSFSIITENVPCGTTGVTCSKAIKIFIGRTELKLEDKHRVVIQRDVGHHVAYTTREVGQYLVVEASIGIIVIWDKRTTIFIKLAPSYKGTVCGLCGNFDQRSNNDFTTRDHMVVESELDFGNSWKEAPTCPDVSATPEPCTLKPHRRSWAKKQCSIIKSPVFSACHSKVDPTPFYEACVYDSCSCDSGGDCECFCSAVAAYAQECTKEGACVFWRTPDLCRECLPILGLGWHYEPCGHRSFETCRTINGIHSSISMSYLEGCYPRCPKHRPIYDEDLKKCVRRDQCGCYIEDTRYLPGASVPTDDICQSCVCTKSSKVVCRPKEEKILNYTQDGFFCYWELCGLNGTVEQHFNICRSTLSPSTSSGPTSVTPVTSTTATTTTIITTTPTSTETSNPTPNKSTPIPTTTCVADCKWTGWLDSGKPNVTKQGADIEPIRDVCGRGWVADIACRAQRYPNVPIKQLGQTVVCDTSVGLVCKNQDQKPGGRIPLPYCLNYEINVYCCGLCFSTASPTTTETSTVTPITTTTTTTTTTPETSTPTTTTTTTTTETPTPTPTTVTSPPTTTETTQCWDDCQWTGWLDSGKPNVTKQGAEIEPIRDVCGRGWVADIAFGLVCKNQDQKPGGRIPLPYCLNYEINVYCCGLCFSTASPTTTETSTVNVYCCGLCFSTASPTTTETSTVTPITTTTTTTTPETSTPTTTTTTTTTETPTPTPTTVTSPPTTTETTLSSPTTTETSTVTPITTTTTTTTPDQRPQPRPPPPQPTTTETPTPTPTTVTSSPTTTETTLCWDDCQWTGWLDSGKPNFTKQDADIEPIGDVCGSGWVADISCRATKFPNVPIEQLGQRVVCNTSVGLVCKNQDQKTILKHYCLNYEINVYCCSCAPTSTPTTTEIPTSTSTPQMKPPAPRPPACPPLPYPRPALRAPSSPPARSPPPTLCIAALVSPPAGEVVYNGTYKDTCYFVNCSLDCSLQFFNWSCPSTPSPTPSTPTPTPTPSTTSTVSLVGRVVGLVPLTLRPPCPQENETWWLCNCTMATCKHDNTVEIVQVECEPPPRPTCSNNLTPVRVLDPDGCCWHWECDCYCTGWGDPHYTTFDGLYYSYQGNCTYVLVEEVNPTVDNFGVYIDNYHCDVTDRVSCPRTLIVRHESQEVQLRTVQMLPLKVQVQVNEQSVALPYKKFGLQVYELGFKYVVDIPELDALISYDGLSFSIRLPYRLFGNNTKGQCGTCTNTTSDDCVLPSGEVISNCEVAADQWVVDDPSKPHCPHSSFTSPRPSTTTASSRTPTPKDCDPSLCELIKDSLFAECHALVPPQQYYDACVFDSCFVPNSGLECASLQTYAALCAHEGICIDWRNHTQGACPVTCPSHREYRACGPAEEPTCGSSSSLRKDIGLVEGCFCPEGTTSYAPGFDVCVEFCGCVGPDDVPRKFGERFEFDCKDCVCLEGGRGIVCQPRKCSQKPLPECKEDGTYLVTEVNPDDTCCTITSCKCNASLCREKPPECSLGFELKSEMVPGRCCPLYSCVPKNVCVVGNAEYQPGSPVYSSKCQDCVCTGSRNSTTQLNVISCTHVPCSTSCSPGYKLVEAPGECCMKCEQTHCIINQPSGQYILKGSITLMPNGCCRKCILRNETRIPCSTIPVTKEISHAGCSKLVTMNYCSGSCGTFAMYSAEAQALDHRCTCCKEGRTSQRKVVLDCPRGGSREYTYTHIESCLCQDTMCKLPPTPGTGPTALPPSRG
uniref:Mucin-2 n=1 Tax=Equus asinus TaxID=9793 RepID=A0A9L0I4W9_EQUAS